MTLSNHMTPHNVPSGHQLKKRVCSVPIPYWCFSNNLEWEYRKSHLEISSCVPHCVPESSRVEQLSRPQDLPVDSKGNLLVAKLVDAATTGVQNLNSILSHIGDIRVMGG